MKIRIRSEEHSCTIVLPTRMLFSKGFLKFGLRVGRKYSSAVPDIPPQAVDALCDEIKRIKETHGKWELVDIHSGDGEEIKVIL